MIMFLHADLSYDFNCTSSGVAFKPRQHKKSFALPLQEVLQRGRTPPALKRFLKEP